MPLVVKLVTPATATQTGTLVAGSPTVIGLADTTQLAGAVGVSGAGVAQSTAVASIDSPTQVTLTQPATSSGSVSLAFALEPVSLAEAKTHLKMDGIAADDALIARLIPASRRYCEVVAKRSFLNQTFDLVDDAFPFTGGTLNRQVRQFMGQFTNGGGAIFPGVTALNAGVIQLPRAPVVSVTSITYLDVSGTAKVWASGNYVVTTGSPGRICASFGTSWPATLPVDGAVTIRFTAGYGATSASVVETDKAAVLIYLGALYRNRDGSGDMGGVFDTVSSLLACDDNSGGYA